MFAFRLQICGATLAILGTLMVLDIKDVSYTKELLTVNSVSIVTLVLGTLVFIISLLGCCGALCGQPCQLRAVSGNSFDLLNTI